MTVITETVGRSRRRLAATAVACAVGAAGIGIASASADTQHPRTLRVAAHVGSSSALAASKQLVEHYRPSQATGWLGLYSMTVGGHVSSAQVSYRHETYRISLLPFGQAGSSPNPVCETVPKDPDVAFKKTLDQEYGRHYTFKYLGGLPSGAEFVIESYGVRLYRRTNGLGWGSDLYAVYEPGKTGPAIDSDLQFIQVIHTTAPGPGERNGNFVDSGQAPGSPTPYSGKPGSGLTSIKGHQLVNYYDPGPTLLGAVTPNGGVGPQVDRIETFLAKGTGRRNAAGKQIVDVYGGFEWGFVFKVCGSGDRWSPAGRFSSRARGRPRSSRGVRRRHGPVRLRRSPARCGG